MTQLSRAPEQSDGWEYLDATIALNGSLSAAVDLGVCRIFAILMPADWTTANLTFQGSVDGSSFANIYDDAGDEVVVYAAASRFIIIAAPQHFFGVRFIKVRSGTSGSAVSQAGARSITLVAAPI